MPTVKELDEAYGADDGYPSSGTKDEKMQFAADLDDGASVGGLDEADEEPKAKSESKSGEVHLLFDSIHYQDEDGHWQEHLIEDGPVKLPAKEVKRLTELGAVSASQKEASEHRAALAAAQSGVPFGSTSPG